MVPLTLLPSSPASSLFHWFQLCLVSLMILLVYLCWLFCVIRDFSLAFAVTCLCLRLSCVLPCFSLFWIIAWIMFGSLKAALGSFCFLSHPVTLWLNIFFFLQNLWVPIKINSIWAWNNITIYIIKCRNYSINYSPSSVNDRTQWLYYDFSMYNNLSLL